MVVDKERYTAFYIRSSHALNFKYFAVMDGMGRIFRHLNHSGAARPDPVDLSKNVFHRKKNLRVGKKARSKSPSPFEKRGW